jgi:RNA polymerase sigma-70 factor (ECF subfamily)
LYIFDYQLITIKKYYHSDIDLWRALVKGERAAQRFFYEKFSGQMNGICLRYSKDKDEAEDLLQESFIRAFRNIKQFDGKGSLGAWLRRITINVCLEMYRKNKTRSEHIANYAIEIENDDSLDNALHNLAWENLIEKIQTLPLGFRTVFNLYAIEGFTHNEIADLLQISVGTSKSQYSRARQLLREKIENEALVEQKILGYAPK